MAKVRRAIFGALRDSEKLDTQEEMENSENEMETNGRQISNKWLD